MNYKDYILPGFLKVILFFKKLNCRVCNRCPPYHLTIFSNNRYTKPICVQSSVFGIFKSPQCFQATFVGGKVSLYLTMSVRARYAWNEGGDLKIPNTYVRSVSKKNWTKPRFSKNNHQSYLSYFHLFSLRI